VPTKQFTAPMRRAEELSEYLLLLFVMPWGIWLLNILGVVHNVVHR
jgi:hypothetical protein